MVAFKVVDASDAGWSSPVARWAHNPKVVSSNLTPATKLHEAFRDRIPESLFVVYRLSIALATQSAQAAVLTLAFELSNS